MPFIFLFALIATLALPAHARAQVPHAWDVSVHAGGIVTHAEMPPTARYFERWPRGGIAGISAGRYWTTHFKTELEVGRSAEMRRFVEYAVIRPGVPPWASYGTEEDRHVTTGALLATWQFLDNQWVHPYVSAGIGISRTAVTTRVWEQPFAPEEIRGPGSSVAMHGIFGMGAKFYLAPRAFLRGDVRAAITSRLDHAQFRVGAGIDF